MDFIRTAFSRQTILIHVFIRFPSNVMFQSDFTLGVAEEQ